MTAIINYIDYSNENWSRYQMHLQVEFITNIAQSYIENVDTEDCNSPQISYTIQAIRKIYIICIRLYRI